MNSNKEIRTAGSLPILDIGISKISNRLLHHPKFHNKFSISPTITNKSIRIMKRWPSKNSFMRKIDRKV